MIRNRNEAAGFLALCVVLALGAACSDNPTIAPPGEISVPSPPIDPVTTGGADAVRLTVAVHDAPAPAIREAWVRFVGVSARVAGGGWVALDDAREVSVDLLTLVGGRSVVLADALVPAGSYDGVRLDIAAARVVDGDGVSREVLLPGPRVAVEHPVEFTCVRGAPLVVTLDFPVESSFRLTTAGVAFTPTLATDAVRVAP